MSLNIEQEKALRVEIDRAEIDARRAKADGQPYSEEGFDLDTTSLMKEGNNYTKMCINYANANTLFWHLIDLTDLEAQYAQMTASTFEECTLTNARFEHATLTYARFRGCVLTGSRFTAAKMDEVDCSTAKMDSAFLQTLSCLQANFYGADLSHSDMSTSDLRKSNFHWANLTDTNLSSCELAYCDFTNANLANASLNYSDLDHTIFESKAQLLTANLKKIKDGFMLVFIDSSLKNLQAYLDSLTSHQNTNFFLTFHIDEYQTTLLSKFLSGLIVGTMTPVREVLIDWVQCILQVKQKGQE